MRLQSGDLRRRPQDVIQCTVSLDDDLVFYDSFPPFYLADVTHLLDQSLTDSELVSESGAIVVEARPGHIFIGENDPSLLLDMGIFLSDHQLGDLHFPPVERVMARGHFRLGTWQRIFLAVRGRQECKISLAPLRKEAGDGRSKFFKLRRCRLDETLQRLSALRAQSSPGTLESSWSAVLQWHYHHACGHEVPELLIQAASGFLKVAEAGRTSATGWRSAEALERRLLVMRLLVEFYPHISRGYRRQLAATRRRLARSYETVASRGELNIQLRAEAARKAALHLYDLLRDRGGDAELEQRLIKAWSLLVQLKGLIHIDDAFFTVYDGVRVLSGALGFLDGAAEILALAGEDSRRPSPSRFVELNMRLHLLRQKVQQQRTITAADRGAIEEAFAEGLPAGGSEPLFAADMIHWNKGRYLLLRAVIENDFRLIRNAAEEFGRSAVWGGESLVATLADRLVAAGQFQRLRRLLAFPLRSHFKGRDARFRKELQLFEEGLGRQDFPAACLALDRLAELSFRSMQVPATVHAVQGMRDLPLWQYRTGQLLMGLLSFLLGAYDLVRVGLLICADLVRYRHRLVLGSRVYVSRGINKPEHGEGLCVSFHTTCVPIGRRSLSSLLGYGVTSRRIREGHRYRGNRRTIPYYHDLFVDKNTQAHLRALLIGHSLPLRQKFYLLELDRPRMRRVLFTAQSGGATRQILVFF